MSNDPLQKINERDKAMRAARDEILRRVSDWLRSIGFVRAGVGHFTRLSGDQVCHIGFQKLSSGRSVRVMCSIVRGDDRANLVSGPRSDAYTCPNSPNNIKYRLSWSTREADIARCADEYCRYIADVVLVWFNDNITEN